MDLDWFSMQCQDPFCDICFITTTGSKNETALERNKPGQMDCVGNKSVDDHKKLCHRKAIKQPPTRNSESLLFNKVRNAFIWCMFLNLSINSEVCHSLALLTHDLSTELIYMR